MSNEIQDNIDKIEYLYRNEYSAMLRYARRVLSNEGLAEDAVQDTFQIAINKPEKLLDSPNPTGWLYETLKNVLMHALRDRKKLQMMIPEDSVPERELSTDDLILRLTTLYGDDEEMRLLIMFYVYGYRAKELAKMLGISEAACKMRIRRARAHKKDIIER